jgi:4-amino-4-deoxy-L-arabinose transferase-like glycosyltransferase
LPVIGNWRYEAVGNRGHTGAGSIPAELFLLIWCAAVVVLFSISQSKLFPYVMPVMPALAVVLARVTQAQPSAYPRAKWLTIGFLLLLLAGIVFAV